MNTVERIKALDEVLDFFTSSPTLEQIIAFNPSEAAQERIRYLLAVNQNGRLTAEEQAELDELGQISHFVRLLKIHSQRKLNTR